MKLTDIAHHRKVLFITIAIFVVILLLPLVVILANKSAIKKNTGAQTVSSSPVEPTSVPYNPFISGGRAQEARYSIAYPHNSQNTFNTFDGGSTLIIEPPVGTYPGEPVFDVEAYSSTQNIAQKQSLYLASGAKKATLVINNMSLEELANTYQMRTINYQHIHTPTQLRLAYLVQPNSLYIFRMYYSSSVPIQADEDLFAAFIKSFTLKQ